MTELFHGRVILKIFGWLIFMEGIFMFLCLPFSFYYGAVDAPALFYSGLITTGSGALFGGLTGRSVQQIEKRDAYLIVTLVWVLMAIFGSLPYLFSGAIPHFTDACFEAISGFTTTGASVLTNIEAVPHGILFWRSLTHWIGGMGIIVLSIAILPFLRVGGMQLFSAEAAGPQLDKLHPRIRYTAQGLWGVYVLLTIVETGFLMAGGMGLFDALCHAFGTIATGGFSTKNASLAGYSPYIQYVVMVFMLLSGISFSLHFYALNRRWDKIKENEELRYYLRFLLMAGLFVTISLVGLQHLPVGAWEKAFRDAFFQVISIVTSTGFVSADYWQWPVLSWVIIFLLMFSGACVGSTSGGIKMMRHVVLIRNSRKEIRRMMHPSAIIPVKYNGAVITKGALLNTLAFLLLYILIFVVGSMILVALGMDFESSMGGVASCLAGIGPGLGTLGPVSNYAAVPEIGKWVLSGVMLLGRLEIFTVIILFSPIYWKK